MIDFPIFIPSYHRPTNVKTLKYYIKHGFDPKLLYVFVDSETDDIDEYEKEVKDVYGANLIVFDMDEARERYDYVHRPSPARRSAGQARNMMHDYARENGIDFYMVQDDDTNHYQVRPFGIFLRQATAEDISLTFMAVKEFMLRRHIGIFGLSQTGDLIGGRNTYLFRKKVMNTTFIQTKYIYRGEKGVQDDDTAQFAGVMNEGLFTGSTANGLILQQTSSATQQGGLTDLYKEIKLLNKAMVVPIMFPSAAIGEKQKKNGGRLHHRINYRFLMPKLIRGERSNIEWDAYPEDYPFTSEPLNRRKINCKTE